MIPREVKKELMKFVRREVKEKGAEWGELRRIKRLIVIKKGLPSVPNLVIATDAGLSYVVLIHWKKEIRLYLFNAEGIMLHGHSYFSSFEEVSKDLYSKSKKIARYPPPKKILTHAQQNYQLDKKFQRVWVRLAKILKIPKTKRRQRPLIKGLMRDAEGIFGTKFDKGFIYIPYKSSKLGEIFYYYSLFSFLPSSIKQNKPLAEAIAVKLLISFKKINYRSIIENHDSLEILQKMNPWDSLKPLTILNLLKKITMYYSNTWRTQDFLSLLELPLNLIKTPSRKNLPEIFCQLFTISQNEAFHNLANILGLPFNIECTISRKISEDSSVLLTWLRNWQISTVLSYLQKDYLEITKGRFRAIEEAMNFLYANVLQVELTKKGLFEIRNKSDTPIILTSAIQILPNGTESEIVFQKIHLKANSTILFDLNSLNITEQYPLRIQYLLVRSIEDISRPVFTGTLIL
ncbi:MAG: hypothetical protein ACFFB5_22515 [Promethearchaeota archaeon]